MASGIIAPPTLEGVHLSAAAASTTVRTVDQRGIVVSAVGGLREQRTWWGEAALDNPDHLVPLRRLRHEVEMAYQNLADTAVAEILAVPGTKDLVVWRQVVLAYRGDGLRRAGWMPWRLAVDVVGAPQGMTPAQADAVPVVRIGDGAPLAYALQPPASYDGSDPVSGEVWFRQGDRRFKLGDTPGAGELVYAHVVPVLRVLDATDDAQSFNRGNLFKEPRSLRFREV